MHKKAKMMRLFIIFIAAAAPLLLCAQTGGGRTDDGREVSDSLSLDEVVVKSSRIKNKDGVLRMFPTKEQKDASATGYGLLSRLSLPYITVDEVKRTITVPPNLGQVQVRVNGVLADSRKLMSLDMAAVKYVDFIQNPGVRYGKDVKFLINIVTGKTENGYAAGVTVDQALTMMRANDDVFVRLNRTNSEFGVNYSFGYTDSKNVRYKETSDYLMPDNTVYTVSRKDIDARMRNVSHGLQLQYSFADSSRYILQVTLDGNILRMPDNMRRRLNVYGDKSETVTVNSSDDTKSAMLDTYFSCNLTPRQSLTATLTGSYQHSDYSYAYKTSSPYSYFSTGNSRSLYGELVYENRLRPFVLSAGLNCAFNLSSNGYEGDAEATNDIYISDVYAFAQICGQLSALSYKLGTGVSRRHYSQGVRRFDYWLWRPGLNVSYSPVKPFTLTYDFSITQHPPRLEYLGDVEVMNNEFEITKGNPGLQANRVVEQSLQASFEIPSLYTAFTTAYRRNLNCSMQQISRTAGDDGRTYYVFTRTNQPRIDLFYVDNYTRYDVLQNKLSLTFMGGLYRCFNYGDDYRHHYSAFNWSARADAYLGRLSLAASVNNGWSFLEGEAKNYHSWSYYLSATYRVGTFNISLNWQNCFRNNVRMYHAELLNRYVHKTQSMTSGDIGNMLGISVSWRMSGGHRRKALKRNITKPAIGTGIIKSAGN